MAENKIFAGPRVRRIRNGLGLTQTAMAEALEISPSYLNLIERNQRPLTVQLLLKLATVYKVDLDELQGEAGGTAGQLREVFGDPLLSGEVPGDQELIEVAEAAPNAAAGVVKLYRAYREQAARLSDLAELLAREGHETSISGTRLPIDEVREKLERRANFYARIEDAAEAFHATLGLSPGEDLAPALKAWLRTKHGIVVRTLPIHTMPNLRRRYDRHSMRLFLSERLSPFDQLREVAMEAALLAFGEEIAAELEGLAFSTGEAKRLGRFELARYAAHAVIMPYGAFLSAAQRARYDIDMLRSRFNVSYEQAANRLTMLQRPGGCGRAVLHARGRQCRPSFPQGGRPGLPPGEVRRQLSQAQHPCCLRPAGSGAGRCGRDAGWHRFPHRVAHARRSAGRFQRARQAHGAARRLRHRPPRRGGLRPGGGGRYLRSGGGRNRLPAL